MGMHICHFPYPSNNQYLYCITVSLSLEAGFPQSATAFYLFFGGWWETEETITAWTAKDALATQQIEVLSLRQLFLDRLLPMGAGGRGQRETSKIIHINLCKN